MSLTVALYSALSGLNVNQTAMSVVSQNIANANTDGYSRKVVDQSAVHVGSTPAGVRVEDIARKVDIYLQRAIRSNTSQLSMAETVQDYYERMQIFFGEPGDNNSINAYLDRFFTEMRSLAVSPEQSSLKYGAVSSGVVLAEQLSGLAAALEDLRYQADQDIDEVVENANIVLQELYNTNIGIAEADALGNPVSGLLDERDRLLEELSSIMDVKLYFQKNGEVSIYTGNGIGLLDENLYQLSYATAPSMDTFINNGTLRAIEVTALNAQGQPVGKPQTLVSEGTESEITTELKAGKLKGLVDLRDTLLPDILSQLDELAQTMVDEINAIHNDGAGFPAANSLTGTTMTSMEEIVNWSGSVRLAVLNSDGTAITERYADVNGGVRPLTIDLSSLDSGFGAGYVTVRDLINEINNHFQPPQKRVQVNNLFDVKIASSTDAIAGGLFNFDFDVENISADGSDFYVEAIRVFDDTAALIDNQAFPAALDAGGSVTTMNGSTSVTINQVGHGYSVGDKVSLSGIAGPVNGIPNAELNTTIEITSVTPNSFSFTTTTAAIGPALDTQAVGGTSLLVDTEVQPGEHIRTSNTYTADFSGNAGSAYYTVEVDVLVDDGNGPMPTTIQYIVPNNVPQPPALDVRNDRFSVSQVTAGGGIVYLPNTSQRLARAELVDANGTPVSAGQSGYLRISTQEENYIIAFDEMDSTDLGLDLAGYTAREGTERGLSHYFGMNNFFVENETVTNSAINMHVREDIVENPNLVSTGELTQSHQYTVSAGNSVPLYTYELGKGNNDVALRMADLGLRAVSFDASSGLAASQLTFSGFAAEILGYSAGRLATSESAVNQSKLLLEGFTARSEAVSGVNVDEELSYTILYQNAYAASARIISVTDELFQTLLASFGR